MKPEEYIGYDALGLADLVRRKEVTSIELVEAAISQIELLNPSLNAVITPMFDQGRDRARGELPAGPFCGVPYLLKDLGAFCAGVRLTMGSAFLQNFIPDHDTELVLRLKRAGLIIIGKTNTPEFGLLPTTEPHLFGPCRNPWERTRTTGGSSGGSAAAVAAGIVPMAHANDGGGSIRIPASCCGVFGLKPTRARNPLGPDLGDMYSGLIVEHAVTRSVRDCAALLDATAGPDLGDPYWAPPPARPFLEEVGLPPARLKIAFSTKPFTEAKIHEDCARAVKEAAFLCQTLGHEVEEAAPSVNGSLFTQAFMTIFSGGLAWSIDGLSLATGQRPSPEFFEPLTWACYEMGQKHTAPSYLISLTLLQRISREVARFFEKYDLWLTPTLAMPPVELGFFTSPPEDPLRGFRKSTEFIPFTPLANATGQPAMSVPLYWNEDGLPIGVHFLARFGDEATLFRLAAQLETACPWGYRRPKN